MFILIFLNLTNYILDFTIKTLDILEYLYKMNLMEIYKSSEITVHKLNELRDADKKIQIIDVREDTERDHAHVKGTLHIKLSEIANRYSELDGDKKYFCNVPYWYKKSGSLQMA